MTRTQSLASSKPRISARNSGTPMPDLLAFPWWLRVGLMLVAVLVACVLMTGCDDSDPVVYTFEGVLGDPPPPFDDNILLGLWRIEKDAVEFQRIGYNHFRLQGSGEDDGGFDFRIVRVENNLFFDMWQQVKPEIATQPLHFTCKLSVQEATFTLSCLSKEWLDEHPPEEVPRVQRENYTILSGSPTELRDWFARYVNDDKAFPVTWVFHRPDLQKVEALRKAAVQGDAEAEAALAQEYQSGENIDENLDDAVRWMSRAAHQGHAGAQYELGSMYLHGRGSALAADQTEAMRWFRKAAEQGHGGAMYQLGQMYEHGNGVSTDATEAAEWYRQAAWRDHAPAYVALGRLQEHGTGVPLDEAAAIEAFGKAVALDPTIPEAWNDLAWLYAAARDPQLRNANKAISCARKAVQLTDKKNANYLGTLAEAYAFSGRPEKAAVTARAALKLTSDPDLKRKLERFTGIVAD